LWGEAFKAIYQPKTEMLELVRKLRSSGYLTALLSNTEMSAVRYYQHLGYDFFDEVVFSCVEHTKKPEREIYELTLKRLGCGPDEVVFVDDRAGCIKGAVAAGLNTIQYKSTEQAKAELGQFGVRVT
jgi:putative hydrolase of the HAD superfamily